MRALIITIRNRVYTTRFLYRVILLLALLLIVEGISALPEPLFSDPISTVVVDTQGSLVGARIAADEQWRFPGSLTIPEKYKTALITFEDKRFNSHFGIDPIALGRALYDNVSQGRIISGASTISMQVIRLARKNRTRNITEKIVEGMMALRLELLYSKDEILALYMAHAPFGGNIVGLHAASYKYFRRPPQALSWGEAALLAVLPNAPALIHPGRNRDALKQKRDRLLTLLGKAEVLSALDVSLAQVEEIPPKVMPLVNAAPHLVSRIAQHNRRKHSQSIDTVTINLSQQRRIDEIVQRHSSALATQQVHNAAVLVLDNSTGAVVAYVGNTRGISNEHSPWVDIVHANRSTGSTLKPLLYAMMLQNGYLLPSTVVTDVPTRINGYIPHNFNKQYMGVVPANEALARSLNVPAVRMLKEYGVSAFYDDLKRAGFSTLHRTADEYGLTLILGGSESTLWELTATYSKMAYLLQDTTDQNTVFNAPEYTAGKPFTSYKGFPIEKSSAYLALQAMLQLTRPENESAWKEFSSSQSVAWKTGTSYGHKDAWAIGVNKTYTVGVWVGNADGEGRPGLTGYSAAAPILFDIFRGFPRAEWFETPEVDLKSYEVCAFSGYKAGPHCPQKSTILSHPSGEKTTLCPFHKVIHVSNDEKWQVHGDCEDMHSMKHLVYSVLSPAQEFYYTQRSSTYKRVPPYRADCLKSDLIKGNTVIEILYPSPNSTIYIPRELDGVQGSTIFEAVHRVPGKKLFWHIDNQFVLTTQEYHQLVITPEEGEHTLTVMDEAGESVQVRFVIEYRG